MRFGTDLIIIFARTIFLSIFETNNTPYYISFCHLLVHVGRLLHRVIILKGITGKTRNVWSAKVDKNDVFYILPVLEWVGGLSDT